MSDEITEEQLSKLNELLKELKENSKGTNRIDFMGDDELMIKAVTEAAKYANGEESSFLEDIVHIKSSYTKDMEAV